MKHLYKNKRSHIKPPKRFKAKFYKTLLLHKPGLIKFGFFKIQTLENGFLSKFQLIAFCNIIKRKFKQFDLKKTQFSVRVNLNITVPFFKNKQGIRMGRGKGDFLIYVAKVLKGDFLIEINYFSRFFYFLFSQKVIKIIYLALSKINLKFKMFISNKFLNLL